MEPTYKSYEDWYDTGPGSEFFKRKLLSPGKLRAFPNPAPEPRRASDLSDGLKKWAEEYWSKPSVFAGLMKQQEGERVRDLIDRAKTIIVMDAIFDKADRISLELDKRGKDLALSMCYRGEYRGD